jgi:hypothetical protein
MVPLGVPVVPEEYIISTGVSSVGRFLLMKILPLLLLFLESWDNCQFVRDCLPEARRSE